MNILIGFQYQTEFLLIHCGRSEQGSGYAVFAAYANMKRKLIVIVHKNKTAFLAFPQNGIL